MLRLTFEPHPKYIEHFFLHENVVPMIDLTDRSEDGIYQLYGRCFNPHGIRNILLQWPPKSSDWLFSTIFNYFQYFNKFIAINCTKYYSQ